MNTLNCNSLLSKQLNNFSLLEQNLESNSFSFESIPNTSDTQNLIFIPHSQTQNNHQTFQTERSHSSTRN